MKAIGPGVGAEDFLDVWTVYLVGLFVTTEGVV